jgi:predicted Ser/Thr protein kinase
VREPLPGASSSSNTTARVARARKNYAMDSGRRRLAGRYDLGEVIGRGGMGAVYRARDLTLQRTVAVKVLPAALADADADHVARFEREARAAASLAHPGVVAIYDTGADDGTRFIVMECVNGRSLSQILRQEAPLEPARAVGIAEGVADALGAAHAAGIVHRDVKPANVMLAEDGAVKVLDFGIARARDATALTQSASVLGTAGYMAPEQALGQRADERSDIYSLGCLLYALLAARPPFEGDGPAAVLHQHVNSAPEAPSAFNRGVSPALDALVMQMLAKSPARRPQTAAEVRERLGEALTTAPTVPVAAPTARAERTPATRVLRRAALPNRRRRAAALAAVAGAALLIVLILLLGSGTGSRHPAPRKLVAASTKTAPPRARTSSSTAPAKTSSAPASARSAPATPTGVAGAAGALAALLTQDAQAGKIDPQAARRIGRQLAGVLNAYGAGSPLDAQHGVTELAHSLAAAEGQGQIEPAAVAPLQTALGGLNSALLAATQTQGAQAGREFGPPGHAGKAKKHGDGGERAEGD